jgi:hypothetical protein
MATKPNWEAMLSAWKSLVAKPHNAALRAVEKNGGYLSRMLQEVKVADGHFYPTMFKRYQDLCLRLDLLISRCKDITDHYIKGLPDATKFLNGVSQAAKNRKTSAQEEVKAWFATIRHTADKALVKLIRAGNDRAVAARAWLDFRDDVDIVGLGEGFPKMNDVRRAILNMLSPDDKNSKVSLHDYKAAIFNFIQATGRAY